MYISTSGSNTVPWAHSSVVTLHTHCFITYSYLCVYIYKHSAFAHSSVVTLHTHCFITCSCLCAHIYFGFKHSSLGPLFGGARFGSVVRAFTYGVMAHRIHPSWWTHCASSRSSLCFTTGVTKVVVCAILSVG